MECKVCSKSFSRCYFGIRQILGYSIYISQKIKATYKQIIPLIKKQYSSNVQSKLQYKSFMQSRCNSIPEVLEACDR